jgi:hypothetical protein
VPWRREGDGRAGPDEKGQTTKTWSSTSNLHIYGRNRSPIADHGSSTGIFMGNYLYYSYLSRSTDQRLRQSKRGASPTAATAVGFVSSSLKLCSFSAGSIAGNASLFSAPYLAVSGTLQIGAAVKSSGLSHRVLGGGDARLLHNCAHDIGLPNS